MQTYSYALDHPYRFLTSLFVVWKAFLFFLALLSPGAGYDTSTSLLSNFSQPDTFGNTSDILDPLILKLVRWDAIYFTHLSTRGHVFEQEWAFGIGLSGPVSAILRLIQEHVSSDPVTLVSIIAIAISHLAHWLSVLVIFKMVKTIFNDHAAKTLRLPLLASILHVLSPAGLFLSAPYTEALFSFLSIFGCYLYIAGMAKQRSEHRITSNLCTISSGIVLGASTIVRSNGILGGLPFLYDATLVGWTILRSGPNRRTVSKLAALAVGGSMIATGFALPQYIAFNAYCSGKLAGSRRSWCEATLPSIYSFVQDHYWNVGLFRYWTISNLPLFLLALPTLSLLIYSAVTFCTDAGFSGSLHVQDSSQSSFRRACIIRLAVPQGLLAVFALTIYHVQIITRLSSGYVPWYIWLAKAVLSESGANRNEGFQKSEAIVRWMVVYGVVQAGLFASFLPPA